MTLVDEDQQLRVKERKEFVEVSLCPSGKRWGKGGCWICGGGVVGVVGKEGGKFRRDESGEEGVEVAGIAAAELDRPLKGSRSSRRRARRLVSGKGSGTSRASTRKGGRRCGC